MKRVGIVNVQYIKDTRGSELTSAGSSSYTARSIILTNSSSVSGAQVTDFFLPSFLSSAGRAGLLVETFGGGVAVAGESLRGFSDLTSSSKGLYEDGCATLGSGSFFTVGGAFLKSGNLGFGFEAEKNEESVFGASFTTVFVETTFLAVVVGVFDTDVRAVPDDLFASGTPLGTGGGSSALRFLLLMSESTQPF